MNDQQKIAARTCLEGAEANTMTFPKIVGVLMEAGYDGYAIDFRRAMATYYLPDGESIELSTHKISGPVASTFDPMPLQGAIRKAQEQVPGFSYRNFCEAAASAGCAGYIVSVLGRRVLYFGRTAESHVEHFPNFAG